MRNLRSRVRLPESVVAGCLVVKTRNSKAEIQKKAEDRNPKSSGNEFVFQNSGSEVFSGPGIRISDFFRPLDRGFRVRSGAFTLIEIMIVVGIMGLIMTMSVPIVYKVWHRAPMAEALKSVVEVCSNARAQAIMQGTEVDVTFHPRNGNFEISGGAAIAASAANSPATIPAPAATLSPTTQGANSTPLSGRSGRFSEHIRIDMLDINKWKHDFRDDELARVRFFPNGTSDELTLIISSDTGEQRGVVLEVTTGLASVLSEPELQNLRNAAR